MSSLSIQRHLRSIREQQEHRAVLLLLCTIALCAGCQTNDRSQHGQSSPTTNVDAMVASAFATVQAEVAFDLAFPTYMPAGFELYTWVYAPADSPIATPGTAAIQYLYVVYRHESSVIEIRQSSGFNNLPSASDVTPGLGTPVSVNDIPGEVVVYDRDGETVAMVAWVDQDIVYEVLTPSTQEVSQDDLLKVAESLTQR